ncbi:amino acid adenylation domain-containing protein [Leptothermofonsia sp. ETS-13]|uniref:amino acid adenylation domain-containing protein n=1 Tax=Leptothermofonsia sp. ETS-13 TaxID=3035696 RepID=UPI003BA20B1C
MSDSSKPHCFKTVIEDSYPLSPMQQGMLFHSLRADLAGVDIEQVLCTLHEDLNLPAFEQAWQRIIERHPVLRTSFHWEGSDEPVQIVHRSVEFLVARQDWQHFSAEEQKNRLDTYLEADRRQGFDLAQAPLMRLAIFQISQAEYQIVWTFHHILLDGRSLLILLKEVFGIYETLCQGQTLPLSPSRPYRDYIQWLKQQGSFESAGYWRQLLNSFDTPTPLPGIGTAGNLTCSAGPGNAQLNLSEEMTAALRSLAEQYNLTPNTLVQGAWGLLLSYYSGNQDVVFGATRACRHSALEGAESMVGLLINTLPVRVQIAPDKPLLQWLQELRSQHIAVRPYEHTPLAEVQKWSAVPPGTPLFESIVVFENYLLTTELKRQGGNWQRREFHLFEHPPYPLVLTGNLDAELRLRIFYDRQRFEFATIARLLQHLHTLLEGMVTHPGRCLGELPVLTEAERHQILVEWNATDVEYPRHLRLHDLVEAQVARSPAAVAVVFDGQRLTYRELNQRANQLAHHLQTLGIGPEVTVGICLQRSLEMVIALLAVLKAGGAYVPLDPTYPPERLAHILTDAELAVILTQETLLPILPESGVPTLCLDVHWQKIAHECKENPVSPATAENLAYIIYTSGSTGQPKGVLIEHRGAVNTILDVNRRFGVNSQDRVLAVCSLNFDLSVYDILGLLAAGGTVVLPQPAIAPDLNHWIDLMEQEQVTLWNSAPPVMQTFAGYLVDCDRSLPHCLRLVLLSGDWIPITLPDLIRQLKRGAEPIEIISLGGATEASIWSILYPIGAIDPSWKSIPYGRPMANQQFYILNPQRQPVPVGQIGELYIGGDGVGRGYHNRPDLNAIKFLPDPFRKQPGARLYRTGDLGRYRPDGTIEFLGRTDHQVKIRGFRIELGEIEAVLMQHPAVREAAILAQEDVLGNKQLVAYLVPQRERGTGACDRTIWTKALLGAALPIGSPSDLLIHSIRSYLKEKLPDYMVPAAFVLLEGLPLTPNGKLDRKALLTPSFAQQSGSDSGAAFGTPEDDIQRQLVEIWQEFLGVQPISVKDNFFELGGHSLLAVRLWSKVEKAFNQKLPLITLFQAPTIEQLAERLRQPADAATPFCPSLVVIQPGNSQRKPPLFCIHTLGRGLIFCRPFVRYLDPEQPIYGLSTQIGNENFGSNQVEALAQHYVQQMRQIQPEGPYLLVGLSFGGLVAFEMACLLEAQGQTVSLLAMLDTRSPYALRSLSLAEQLAEHWQQLREMGPQYLFQKLLESMAGQARSIANWIHHMGLELGVQLFRLLSCPLPDRLQDYLFERENVRSAALYVPGYYSGSVTLFKAMEERGGVKLRLGPDLGWQKLVEQLLIHEIPGDHLKMLEEPHVQILGRELQQCISRAIANQ